jgi:glycosylphosphatidylinositol transamidase (GPIT) subunit GPI8
MDQTYDGVSTTSVTRIGNVVTIITKIVLQDLPNVSEEEIKHSKSTVSEFNFERQPDLPWPKMFKYRS